MLLAIYSAWVKLPVGEFAPQKNRRYFSSLTIYNYFQCVGDLIFFHII